MGKPEGSGEEFWFDAQFVESLEKDAESALRARGIEPTPELLLAVKGMDFASLYRIAEAFPRAIGAEAGERFLVFP